MNTRRQFLQALGALLASQSITLEEMHTLATKHSFLEVGQVLDTMNGPLIWTGNEFLVCDGRLVSRKTYWDLYQIIGTLYTDEDERCCTSELFTLPDLRARRAT